jgi:thioredoxin-dependent peroxiredoxin
MMPSVGTKAPDFTLLDQDGKPHTLSSYQGHPVLIYFYPKDDTPGCTKQACAIRDAEPDFSDLNTIVLGISPDTVEKHKKFSEKYHLPFTLLADPEHTVLKAYGVWGKKKFMGREYEGVSRTSFLVAKDGTIAKVYENVKPEAHAAEVLLDLSALRA